jgi:hypothetical protein
MALIDTHSALGTTPAAVQAEVPRYADTHPSFAQVALTGPVWAAALAIDAGGCALIAELEGAWPRVGGPSKCVKSDTVADRTATVVL